MDKKQFCEIYGLSRGQAERLIAKAWKNSGVSEVPGHGNFKFKKSGPGKTSGVEITPVKSATVPPAAPPRTPAAEIGEIDRDLETLPKSELDRLLVAANITRVRQQTDKERAAQFSAALNEVVAIVIESLSRLREALNSMRLSAENLKQARALIDECSGGLHDKIK